VVEGLVVRGLACFPLGVVTLGLLVRQQPLAALEVARFVVEPLALFVFRGLLVSPAILL
jgi:hypothetical protein